jgi:hypothetical protein
MATVNETATAKPQLAAGLIEGAQTLAGNQLVEFTLYIKVVLPLDGYVYWVNANLLNDSAIYNMAVPNVAEYNVRGDNIPPKVITINGSFHFSADVLQFEDRTFAASHVKFTSPILITDFDKISPNMLYIATYEGIQFAFQKHDNYFKQADLYHYRGDAVYSTMTTQVINTVSDINYEDLVVSNSLPIWLTLNQYFPMYPSYLVNQNLKPPFAAVDIDPRETTALQDFQLLDQNSTPNQLVHDKVRITIYGIKNHEALNFVNYVCQYSINTDNIGMMNMPVIQDEKQIQPELQVIAMKKSITFDVSYYQTTVNDIARKVIESAFITLTPGLVPE